MEQVIFCLALVIFWTKRPKSAMTGVARYMKVSDLAPTFASLMHVGIPRLNNCFRKLG